MLEQRPVRGAELAHSKTQSSLERLTSYMFSYRNIVSSADDYPLPAMIPDAIKIDAFSK